MPRRYIVVGLVDAGGRGQIGVAIKDTTDDAFVETFHYVAGATNRDKYAVAAHANEMARGMNGPPADDEPLDEQDIWWTVGRLLQESGLETVGAVRRASDKDLLSIPRFGEKSLAHVREVLGRLH